MRERETVDYTHACGAEHFILLGALQITKGLFTKVKISVLCVCVVGGRSSTPLLSQCTHIVCEWRCMCSCATSLHACVCARARARARTRRSSGLHMTRPSCMCTRKHHCFLHVCVCSCV
jgi:hypothetical protein